MRTLKEMIVNNQQVRFSFYRDGQLWYETECGFRFPVPIEDAEPPHSLQRTGQSSSCGISESRWRLLKTRVQALRRGALQIAPPGRACCSTGISSHAFSVRLCRGSR